MGERDANDLIGYDNYVKNNTDNKFTNRDNNLHWKRQHFIKAHAHYLNKMALFAIEMAK